MWAICHPRPTGFTEKYFTRVGICAKNSPLKKRSYNARAEIRSFQVRLTFNKQQNNRGKNVKML